MLCQNNRITYACNFHCFSFGDSCHALGLEKRCTQMAGGCVGIHVVPLSTCSDLPCRALVWALWALHCVTASSVCMLCHRCRRGNLFTEAETPPDAGYSVDTPLRKKRFVSCYFSFKLSALNGQPWARVTGETQATQSSHKAPGTPGSLLLMRIAGVSWLLASSATLFFGFISVSADDIGRTSVLALSS